MAIDQTSGNGHTEFAKELGLKEAVSIAVGAMIGGGIFSVLGRLAGIAGPSAVLSFLLGGIIVFLTANAYYRLVAKYPSAGGEFVILRKGFDNPIYGNIIGMMLWLGYSITIALYAFTFGLYTSEAVFEFTNNGFFNPNIEDYSGLVIFGFNTLLTGRRLFAFLAILIFMLINLKGVKETGSIQNVIVAFKVAVLMFIGAAGLYLFNPDRYRPFLTKTDPLAIIDGEVGFFGGMGGLIIGSAVIFVSYEGFQVIANTVEELKNPARDVKIGMYISVIVVTITYMVVTVATFSLIDYDNTSLAGNELEIDEAALIDAVRFIGPWAVILVTLGAAASTTSAINATLLGSSRLAYVMSDYRAFPENLATLSKKSRVPYKAIIFTSLISWLFTFFGRAEAIAEVGSIIFLGIFLAINIAVIKIYPQNNNRIAKVAVVLITIYMALVFIFFFTHFDESKLALNVLLIFTIISFLTHFYYNNKEDVKEADLSKYDLQPLGTELIPEFPDDSIAVDDFFIDLENMLVPVSGGQFETKNWQISAVIARKYNVNVTLLYVGTNPENLEKPKQRPKKPYIDQK
ncbi:MAG: amino acid permease [Candidatus Heimdallarchaeota archaeon]|nr:amino acid permease [Candidatus Heimdallarchaeota archaeon]